MRSAPCDIETKGYKILVYKKMDKLDVTRADTDFSRFDEAEVQERNQAAILTEIRAAGCWCSLARSAGTRPAAFDYRRRQYLGGRLGMSET